MFLSTIVALRSIFSFYIFDFGYLQAWLKKKRFQEKHVSFDTWKGKLLSWYLDHMTYPPLVVDLHLRNHCEW